MQHANLTSKLSTNTTDIFTRTASNCYQHKTLRMQQNVKCHTL